jgi:hypothetical protein
MGIFDWLGPIVDIGTDLVNTGFGIGSWFQNQWNLEHSWSREDSSIRRRVADLKAAGLSPVLAAGQGASTMAPMKLDAPRSEISLTDKIAAAQTLMEQRARVDQTKADTDYINQQKENAWLQGVAARIDIAKKMHTFEADVATPGAQLELLREQIAGQGLANTNKKINNRLDELRVTAQDIANTRAEFAKQIDVLNLSSAEEDLLIKQIAVDRAAVEFQNYMYSSDFYAKFGLPYGTSGSDLVGKNAMQLASKIGDKISSGTRYFDPNSGAAEYLKNRRVLNNYKSRSSGVYSHTKPRN